MPRCSWMGSPFTLLAPPAELPLLFFRFFFRHSSRQFMAASPFFTTITHPSSSLFRYSVAAVSLAFTHGFHNGSVAKLISATHAIHVFPQT